MTLLLPWFPILLGAGVGGRLLGSKRGFALGLLCALFWIMLVQAAAGISVWQGPWNVVTLLAGAVAITAIAGWSGRSPVTGPNGPAHLQAVPRAPVPATARAHATDLHKLDDLKTLAGVLDRFDDWLTEHRDDADPWPAFDEFLRSMLRDMIGATHVRPLRVSSDGDELMPLLDAGGLLGGHGPIGGQGLEDRPRISLRKGLLGHVVTTGRSFIADDPGQGELLKKLANTSEHQTAWCFAVRGSGTRLGVVSVGHLQRSPLENRDLLRAAERLVSMFWSTLRECCLARAATADDPASGLPVRDAFARRAERALAECYDQGEPAALVIVAVEGIRTLNDSCRWHTADELVKEISDELKRKVRVDDCAGKFDEGRFVILLRRVDSELAALIAGQLTARLQRICSDEDRWSAKLTVRGGLAGSGLEHTELKDLLARALAQCEQARKANVSLVTDLAPTPVRATARSETTVESLAEAVETGSTHD